MLNEIRPIASAPRDGTEILVWDGTRWVAVAWEEGYATLDYGDTWYVRAIRGGGAWVGDGSGGILGFHPEEAPEWWMPMPPCLPGAPHTSVTGDEIAERSA